MGSYSVNEDTIVAIATPAGNGAIAVIRLSGTDALRITDKVFRSSVRGKKLEDQEPYTVHYGHIVDGKRIIDEVLVSLFRAPRSYTGENVIEISCHGSVYIQQEVVHLFIRHGARLAKPGEYTLRAFLNGKMDLSQAEAVADLVASSSAASHRIAMNQMRGGFSAGIIRLRQELVKFVSLIELELDFSEEDVEFADRTQLKKLLQQISSQISQMMHSFSAGNAIKNGIPVVIAGLPNVGKSTLLNVLLNEDKAIVSDIPGTTRDAIEDVLHIGGYLFRFIDTAGLRQAKDEIETIGVKKTYEKLRSATIILLVVDSGEAVTEIEKQLRALSPHEDQHVVLVANKMDKQDPAQLKEKLSEFSSRSGCLVIPISAKMKLNLDLLRQSLVDLIQKSANEADITITNARHYEALKNASEALSRVNDGLLTGISGDFLSQDIREVLHYLGEITGEITDDEILGNIFRNFCIGK